MNTNDIMQTALDLAGFSAVRGESTIFVEGESICKVLFGIDINDNDLIEAKRQGYNLVISHHPPNRVFTERFCEDIENQIDLLVRHGVATDKAIAAVQPTLDLYRRWNENRDHKKIVSLAQKIGMPLMNIHQPCDELGRRYLQAIVEEIGVNATIGDLIARFSQIPEIQESDETVELVCGSLASPIGNAVVFHGVGTNGGYTAATALFETGIKTVIYIHLFPHQESDRELLIKESKGNLILTGHYASDWIGVNILIRKLEESGITVTPKNSSHS